jgi:hypothetical protein
MRLKTFGSEQSRARVSTAAAAKQIVGSAGQVKWVHRKATKSQFDKVDSTLKCNRMLKEYLKRCFEIKAFPWAVV